MSLSSRLVAYYQLFYLKNILHETPNKIKVILILTDWLLFKSRKNPDLNLQRGMEKEGLRLWEKRNLRKAIGSALCWTSQKARTTETFKEYSTSTANPILDFLSKLIRLHDFNLLFKFELILQRVNQSSSISFRKMRYLLKLNYYKIEKRMLLENASQQEVFFLI